MKYAFITDLHVTGVCRVRTGDPVADICDKLRWVAEWCNSNDARLIIGGDLFDKSIVTDSVKSQVAKAFTLFKRKPISIMGNHDRIYENDDMNFKTSYNVLQSCAVIDDMTNCTLIQPGEDIVIVNNDEGVYSDTPWIAVYHGFLNIEDGRNTFRSDMVKTTAPGVVLLGHDHKEYEDIDFGTYKVVRPGSFFRMDRVEESMRTPKVVSLEFVDGKWVVGHIPIQAARCCDDIFTEKVGVKVEGCTQSYLDLLMSIKNGTTSEEGFVELLRDVADYETIEYVKEILQSRDRK